MPSGCWEACAEAACLWRSMTRGSYAVPVPYAGLAYGFRVAVGVPLLASLDAPEAAYAAPYVPVPFLGLDIGF